MRRIIYHFNRVFNPRANDALYNKFHRIIDPKRFAFFYSARFYVWPCIAELGCTFKVIDDDLMVLLDGIRLTLTNEEEIFIFYEVFYKRQYAFSGLNNPVVIDIGFNLGFSSIFFLKYCQVEKIYAYEPVRETYDAGIINLTNSSLLDQNRIEIYNYGLADSDKSVIVSYNAFRKGSTGAISQNAINEALPKVEIQLKDIVGIMETLPGDNLVFKIDCEGGEYEILRRLDSTGTLRKGCLYIMEWHTGDQNDFPELISILENNRFVVTHTKESKNAGMIFAFRLP